MSTDTDRIVNFCQSFHQFWSLPFQIGVSLFLLHQQVPDYSKGDALEFLYENKQYNKLVYTNTEHVYINIVVN